MERPTPVHVALGRLVFPFVAAHRRTNRVHRLFMPRAHTRAVSRRWALRHSRALEELNGRDVEQNQIGCARGKSFQRLPSIARAYSAITFGDEKDFEPEPLLVLFVDDENCRTQSTTRPLGLRRTSEGRWRHRIRNAARRVVFRAQHPPICCGRMYGNTPSQPSITTSRAKRHRADVEKRIRVVSADGSFSQASCSIPAKKRAPIQGKWMALRYCPVRPSVVVFHSEHAALTRGDFCELAVLRVPHRVNTMRGWVHLCGSERCPASFVRVTVRRTPW